MQITENEVLCASFFLFYTHIHGRFLIGDIGFFLEICRRCLILCGASSILFHNGSSSFTAIAPTDPVDAYWSMYSHFYAANFL